MRRRASSIPFGPEDLQGPPAGGEERAVRLDGDLALVEEDGRVRFRGMVRDLEQGGGGQPVRDVGGPGLDERERQKNDRPEHRDPSQYPLPCGES